MTRPERRVAGLVLAAGAGRRAGGPKALAVAPDGRPWLHLAVTALRGGDAGRPVTVVLGAGAAEACALLPARVDVVEAPDWADGMAASLRAGLAAVAGYDAVLLTLVDLPDVGPDVVERLLDRPLGPDVLARATYSGRPGHPVLAGRDHLAGMAEAALGDAGARAYLERHGCQVVECGDLATGRDEDGACP